MTMRAYNLHQVAERLGVTPRMLTDWLRTHRDEEGRPYYSRKFGRFKLFTELDIARLFAALPQPEQSRCPSTSPRRKANTARTAYAAPSLMSALKSPLAYVTEVARSASSSTSRSKSRTNVIPLPRGRRSAKPQRTM